MGIAEEEHSEVESLPTLLVLNKLDLVEGMINEGYELEEYMTFDYLKKFAE